MTPEAHLGRVQPERPGLDHSLDRHSLDRHSLDRSSPQPTGEMPDVSIVVPALNEAQAIPGLWARLEPLVALLSKMGFETEIVLVNDGSTDDTLALMRALAARSSCIRVVDLARRFGHQAALVAGLDHAAGRAVAVIDADLQDPPELIAKLAELWRAGNDVVYGVRRRREGDGWFKRVSARAFYRLLSWVVGEGVRPDVGDFYLMDRKVVDVLRAGRCHRPFLRGALSQAGFRHIGVPYDRSARWAGSTKYPLRRMLSLAVDAMTSMTFRPLRLASFLGFCLVAGGAVALPVSEMDVRALVVLLSGVQLLAVGLLGEYVGRTHAIATGRPVYLVRELIGAPDRSPGDEESEGRGLGPASPSGAGATLRSAGSLGSCRECGRSSRPGAVEPSGSERVK